MSSELKEFSKHQFKLVKPTKNGTLRQHLEQVEKQTGRKLKELEGPNFPDQIAYVWSAFLCLNDSRTYGGGDLPKANPITYTEIKSYLEATLTVLSSRDVELLKEIDKIYLEVMNTDG